MTSYVALFRGINVGGNKMIPMAELRELLEAEGFADVKTLLQSGNAVFKSKSANAAALESQLEKLVAKKFGHAVDIIVRNRAWCEKIIEGNPFPAEARNDPSHFLVVALKSAPTAAGLVALKSAISGGEYFEAGERCLYLVYPAGIGRSKLTNALIDRKLGTSGTARNWNTMLKIVALMG
jgi:uncharacterized protein (DUF1697 family)